MTKTKSNDYLVVYKLKLAMALMKKGHKPFQTMPNPTNSKYTCWIFEKSPEFLRDFEELLKEEK